MDLEPAQPQFCYSRALAYQAKGDYDRAIGDFTKVVALDPQRPAAYNGRARAHLQQGDLGSALADYDKILQLQPNFAPARAARGDLLTRQGKTDLLIENWHIALEYNPNWVEALNTLAWLLATHQDAKFRDGAEAVNLAARACELTGWKNPEVLDTLAAAYGESRQFDKAVEIAQKAHSLAVAAGTEQADGIGNRLELYRASQPYREALMPTVSADPEAEKD